MAATGSKVLGLGLRPPNPWRPFVGHGVAGTALKGPFQRRNDRATAGFSTGLVFSTAQGPLRVVLCRRSLLSAGRIFGSLCIEMPSYAGLDHERSDCSSWVRVGGATILLGPLISLDTMSGSCLRSVSTRLNPLIPEGGR